MGVLPQGEAEETSCGQISQLISAGPQVIYPVGLNEPDEPIITTLSEPLSRGRSIIASRDLYLGINIPFTSHGGIGTQSIIYWQDLPQHGTQST